ncbi:MAG: DUF4174 domain-containing protein [Bryobacterales bacterium]|nr:DUF4174 domain-containing protein [Bryobacterales bacterium]
MVASCLLGFFAVATASAEESSFRLADLQWKHRLLLVFAANEEDARFARQYAEWQRTVAGMEERDLLWVPLMAGKPSRAAGRTINLASQEAIRRVLGVNSGEFAVLLVGRDGGVKLRKAEPVEAISLFALIDAMPMRREEMRRQPRSKP